MIGATIYQRINDGAVSIKEAPPSSIPAGASERLAARAAYGQNVRTFSLFGLIDVTRYVPSRLQRLTFSSTGTVERQGLTRDIVYGIEFDPPLTAPIEAEKSRHKVLITPTVRIKPFTPRNSEESLIAIAEEVDAAASRFVMGGRRGQIQFPAAADLGAVKDGLRFAYTIEFGETEQMTWGACRYPTKKLVIEDAFGNRKESQILLEWLTPLESEGSAAIFRLKSEFPSAFRSLQ
jgi:hypothetical protein